MSVMFGNLNIKQIEKRCGIDFPEEVKELMKETHQLSAHVDDGKYEWHGFEIPFCIYCGCIELAEELKDRLIKLDWSHAKECLQIQYSQYHRLKEIEE